MKFWFLVFIFWIANFVGAQTDEVVETKKAPVSSKPGTQITINFDEKEEGEDEEQFSSGIGRLFNNPALSSGLASGSAAINRSIESLMEVIFYNLLDQELAFDITDESQFKLQVERQLFQTPHGAFVVVDRFGLGPEYNKLLQTVGKIPISLGVDGKVNVFDIYLRTDGMRLAEQAELPWYRTIFNNWFGILPLLTNLLPPSFDPNEMYDPLNLLETPFSFPLSVGGFKEMPIGSIRSYNISGGVSVPVDFAKALPADAREQLSKWEDLGAALPYTIFVEGEYRINVLRRSKDIAWVGLTKVRRFGHKIAAELGRKIELLDKVVTQKWWPGVPVKFFPLDVEFLKARANIFNQLYEFDLRRVSARRSYERAVRGDFVDAYKRHLLRVEEKSDTGVRFHFTKEEDADETQRTTAPNLIILSNVREDRKTEAEVEIKDEAGRFYVLEGRQEINDIFADVLTGKQKARIDSLVEMNVVREEDPSGDEDYIYRFKEGDDNPYRVSFSMRLQDRYVDSHEYRNYIDKMRFFSHLPLRGVPDIPRRDERLVERRRRVAAVINPTRDHLYLHVTPSYLGRINANAALVFSTKVFRSILNRPTEDVWQAFAKAYGFSARDWQVKQTGIHLKAAGYGSNLLGFPSRLFNIHMANLDFIAEATGAIAALEGIKEAKLPMDKLSSFYDLFNTNHPDRLARALLLLADLKEVPRSVSFHTKAKGHAAAEIKDSFRNLNDKVFRSVLNFPPKPRSRVAYEKLSAFVPGELRERRKKPFVAKIDLKMRELPESFVEEAKKKPYLGVNPEDLKKKHLFLRLYIKNMNASKAGKIFIRFEESGKLKVGKFVIGEKVVKVEPQLPPATERDQMLGVLVYEVFLSGPMSPLSGMIFDNSISFGGEFQVTLSAADDIAVWSDERLMKFNLVDEKLTPAN